MAEMTPQRKRLAIVVIVVGCALIGERVYSLALASGESGNVAEPAVAKRQARSAGAGSAADAASATQATGVRVDRLDARQLALSESTDPWPRTLQLAPFESVSWQPPAPTAPPPPPPPKPVPPPFGYAYMGGLTEDGVRTTFFTQGERIIALKVGDTVDAAFRVDQMTEKQMKLTYLPLNETVVLALGGRP